MNFFKGAAIATALVAMGTSAQAANIDLSDFDLEIGSELFSTPNTGILNYVFVPAVVLPGIPPIEIAPALETWAYSFTYDDGSVSGINVAGGGFDGLEGLDQFFSAGSTPVTSGTGAAATSFTDQGSNSDDRLQILFTSVVPDYDGLLVSITGNFDLTVDPFGNTIASDNFADIEVYALNSIAPVPLPATLPLLLAGFGGMALMRKKRS